VPRIDLTGQQPSRRRPDIFDITRHARLTARSSWRQRFAGHGAIAAVQPARSTDKTLAGIPGNDSRSQAPALRFPRFAGDQS
jgi:hypothetical protein